MVQLFDSHAHLGPWRDLGGQAWDRCVQSGVSDLLLVATGPDQLPALRAAREGAKGVQVHLALGLHPWRSQEFSRPSDALELLWEDQELAEAIGECGLDRSHAQRSDDPESAMREQLSVLDTQLALARRHGRPLILHCVGAHGLLLERLEARPTPPSLLHSFGGSAELGRRYWRAGHRLGISPALLRPNRRKLRQAALELPLASLVLESDAPDLGSFDARDGAPWQVREVCESLASIRGISAAELAQQCHQNVLHTLAGSDRGTLE